MFGRKGRVAAGGSLVMGLTLILNVLGVVDELKELGPWAWALAPVIGAGLIAVGCVLFAAEVPSFYRWLTARTPANKFGADAHRFQRLYERWCVFEERNWDQRAPSSDAPDGESLIAVDSPPMVMRPPENRLLLVADTNALLKKHRIPGPKGTEPDILWKTVILVTLAASKTRDLKTARKQTDWVREALSRAPKS